LIIIVIITDTELYDMLEEALIEAGCTIETRKLIDFLLSDEKPIENPKVLENDESEHSEDNYEEQVSEEFNADTSDEDFEYLRVNKKHKTVKSRNAPRKWTEDENKVISQLVKKYPGNYKKIASILKNRKPILAQHWNRVLKPSIRREKFSIEEELELIEAVKIHGKHWNLVASTLERTGSMYKFKI